MGDFNKDLGVAVIGYLNDDKVDAICETWSKLRAMEYARQLGLRGDEYETFVQSNYESMAPQSGEDAIKLVMLVMGLANGREAEELGIIIMETVAGEVTRAMPFEDAHEALMRLWNNLFFRRVEASAIAEFLGRREDAEKLIFWNAALKDWGTGEDDAYLVGPWTLRSGNLFSLSCLMNQDDVIEALCGLFTPNMTVAVSTKQPNGVADMMSHSVLESAIWTTMSSNPEADATKEADRKRRRRRIIDLLIEGGASSEKVQLARAAYLPSDGDPMAAAKLSGNEEAVAALLHARSKATGDDIGSVTAYGNPRGDNEERKGWGSGTL